jgi:uncharacterized protein
MANRLSEETSPYLLQHADNPVDWYPWGEQALTLAKELNKPILLSVGYSACHWCHVMAHESFEDAEIAALMNQHFINIKVDREERPDIDQIYQTAHGMLSQRSGGWPLTVFMSPEQVPFFTGTYFPKSARYQLPGFADLIPRVAEFYHSHQTELVQQNQRLLEAFAGTIPRPKEALSAGSHTLQMAFQSLEGGFDFEHGGFGQAPKFPNPSDINLLLQQAYEGNTKAEQMALQMLDAMADGGIYDQLGGGFCRYSVDERWNIPHFEKMLYDNGQLLFLYADAYQLNPNPRYRQIVEETVVWLAREMRSPEGAFYSSLDADSLNEDGVSAEGAFYIWQTSEVKALLTPEEFTVASSCLGFDRAPNFTDPHHHTQAWHPYLTRLPEQDEEALFASAKQRLFEARAQRPRPGLDDKILTSWNALVVKGLARASRVFQQPAWAKLAQDAVDFIQHHLWANQRLLATCKAQADGYYQAHLNAYLDDYAFLLDALIDLMQTDYRPADMRFAQALAEVLLTDFQAEEGGFYFTGHSHETLIHRPKSAYDNTTPSGNGIAAVAIQRLGHLLGETQYLDAAERTLKAFDAALARNPAACANLCQALQEHLYPPTVIILRGEITALNEWKSALQRRFLPHHLVLCLPDSLQDLPAVLQRPNLQKNSSEAVNAWICKGVVCSPGIRDLQQLLKSL